MNLHCMQPIASATLNFYALWYLRQLFLSSVKCLQFMSECHVSVSKHQKNQQGHKRDKDECSSLSSLEKGKNSRFLFRVCWHSPSITMYQLVQQVTLMNLFTCLSYFALLAYEAESRSNSISQPTK